MVAKLCLVSLVGLGRREVPVSLPLLYIVVGSLTQEVPMISPPLPLLCPRSKHLLLLPFLLKQQMSAGLQGVRNGFLPSPYADRFCFHPSPGDSGGRRVYSPSPGGLKLFCFNKVGPDDTVVVCA